MFGLPAFNPFRSSLSRLDSVMRNIELQVSPPSAVILMSATIPTITAVEFLCLQSEEDSNLVVLDCTILKSESNGYDNYLLEHIKNAKYFHYLDVTSKSLYPSMMPKSFSEFSEKVGKLGIKSTDKIVIYDRVGFLGSPRATFVFSSFNHPYVACLDSYEAYKQLGGAIESGNTNLQDKLMLNSSDSEKNVNKSYAESTDKPPKMWFNLEEVVNLYKSGDYKNYNVIDTRPESMYLESHLISAINIPPPSVLTDNGSNVKQFKDKTQLKQLLIGKNVDMAKPTLMYCNTATTACVVKAAIDSVLLNPAIIYDGSMTEYKSVGPKEYLTSQ